MSYHLEIRPDKAPLLGEQDIHVILIDGRVVNVQHGARADNHVTIIQDPNYNEPDLYPSAPDLRGENP